jgi:hypothetical protein
MYDALYTVLANGGKWNGKNPYVRMTLEPLYTNPDIMQYGMDSIILILEAHG